jgi:peptidyl-prolyl cis-trans isomerase SurA
MAPKSWVFVSNTSARVGKLRRRMALAGSILLLIFISHLLCGWSSAQQVLDRIVAVVGDQIILESELNMQFDLYANQMGVTPRTEKERSELRGQLLERMINDKLLLIAAQQDTTIEVTAKEVDEAVREQLKNVKSEFTEEEFQAQLQAEGLSESQLKKKYREQIKNQMMIDRLVSYKLSRVSVSTREVKDFFNTYKDSIPDQPEAAKLSHVLLEITASQQTLDSLQSKGQEILKLARQGKDFAQLAAAYSDDPTAKEGGDLGFFARGDMIPKFEEVAFALQPGEISDMVRTEFGYHIIKAEESKGDRIRARHILLLVRPSREDTLRAETLADSLYGQLLEGADFTQLAKEFSADEESKKMGGELGWYPVEQMTPEFRQGVKTLEIGQISPPLASEFGIHILKVLDKRGQRKITLEEDWDAIKNMVRRKKTNELVEKWAEKLRQDTYVEIRL